MKTSSYHLLPVWEPEFGEPVKIAVCKSFREAARAKEDGCDAALIRNAQTRRWSQMLEFGTRLYQNASFLGFLLVLPLLQIIVFVVGQQQKQALLEAGFPRKRVSSRKGTVSFGVHTDRLKDHFGFMAAIPTINLYGKKIVEISTTRQAFPVSKDENMQLIRVERGSCKESCVFSPLPDTFLLFFDSVGGMTIAHSSPHEPDRLSISHRLRPGSHEL